MPKIAKPNKDSAVRLAAIGALAALLYNFLIPLTKDSTFGLGKLPISVSPFFTTILISWILAGIFAGLQAYGVPDWSRPIFRSAETLFFWVTPGLFIYMVSFVGLAWNIPFVWANFVPLFDTGFWAIALAFGFYFSRKIMRETGLKAAIDRYFPKKDSRRVTANRQLLQKSSA